MEPWYKGFILYLWVPHLPGLCLASFGNFGPSLRLYHLGEATLALFRHLLPFLLSFPFLVSYLLLGVMRSGKRGEYSLNGYLLCLSLYLGLHHLYEARPRFTLYPHIFLCLTHLDRRGMARAFGRDFWRWKVVEDFKIVFEFGDVNYLFLLVSGKLRWCGLFLGSLLR